ncbi:MAG TPA: TRAP transporter small permease subunit [Gammaproteobacteria bacterium]|nr:TRAP transporter small permease subunit [Gammaproteobacteria bacterium]
MSWPRRLELLGEWTGRAIAWVMLPMVVVQFVIVALRYVFDLGWIWMQESVLWMHAAAFMLAAAYTLHHDEHVRVDIFYRKLTDRGRTLVEVLGTLLLLLPMMIFLIVSSWDYVSVSWSIREGSREAGGLAYPAVPLLKTLIPVTAGLVCVQAVARLFGDLGRLLSPDDAPDGATEGP